MYEDDRQILLLNPLEQSNDDNADLNDIIAVRPAEADLSMPRLTYLAALTAALGGILFGYDMGIISGAKIQMQREVGLSCSEIGLVVTMLPVGGLFASFFGGILVDKYGRKWTIIMNSWLFMAGALLVALTSVYQVILLGRFVIGFAVSLSAIAECIYISEISTAQKRGQMVSLNELAITVGVLLAFLVNYIFSADDVAHLISGWRIMFGISCIFAILQAVVMIFMPKTPHFLIICKDDTKAENIIKMLKLTSNARQMIADIRLSLDEANDASGGVLTVIPESSSWVLCRSKDQMPFRMFIGLSLVLLQQFSGQPNVIYYASDIFRQVGFCHEFESNLASVGLALTKVFSTFVSLAIVDRVGRRITLTLGMLVMAVSVLILGFTVVTDNDNDVMSTSTCLEVSTTSVANVSAVSSAALNSQECSGGRISYDYSSFVALLTFVCGYSFSFGPVTWIILAEIFPPCVKGRAMSFATVFNWLANILVAGTFVSSVEYFSLSGIFYIYAFVCFLSCFFVIFFVPETKNKTLEEISIGLKNKHPLGLIRDNVCFVFRKNSTSKPDTSAGEYQRVNLCSFQKSLDT